MSVLFGLVAEVAAEQGDGDGVLGFLMIVGIIWFLIWLFSDKNKPKGFDFDSRTTGSVRPR